MTCESENWQAHSAFSDLTAITKLLAVEMDYVESAYDAACDGTDTKRTLKYRLENLEEIYDRVNDLADMVNVEENKTDDSDPCQEHC